MAGLYDNVHIVDGTQKYAFRATKGFYTGAVSTATGVIVSTAAEDLKLPITPVKELLRSGVLKSASALALLGTKRFRLNVHYAAAKAATVEAALVATTVPTIAGRASSGAAINGFSDRLRVTSRS